MQDHDDSGEPGNGHSPTFCRSGENLMRSMAIACQVLMMSKSGRPMNFMALNAEDTDLTMFTITNLSLSNMETSNTQLFELTVYGK